MKKMLTLFLALLMLLSLTGCGMVGDLLPFGKDEAPGTGQQQKDSDDTGKKKTSRRGKPHWRNWTTIGTSCVWNGNGIRRMRRATSGPSPSTPSPCWK